ncbi:amidase signature enzyme [Karstenula rhodostoma CBS 690.94]|uniref:Amidase signature enzyme n=1 Tax=Karstenula rhodostoma CBS 690.94 TaxID=1392251 RepID=A0A9P4PXC5_9PLEO|nr:amidase signature enzyme [Karstenula rhodostoma CBS 690.94]
MTVAGLHTLTASEISRLIKKNEVTVEDYARSLLARIEKRDDIVHAWTYLNPDLVIKQAQRLDGIPHAERGPLHGVAFGIKDILNSEDMPTEFGSPLYKGNEPSMDSSAVGVLRTAGALILGKTVTSEFTVANTGTNTTNPHDPKRTPGGSSCGSAAAVVDFQVPLSVGTQTAGSVIRPASFVGVYAMKPTFSTISNDGLMTYSITVDTFGFFASSVEDLQLVANVFALQDDEVPVEKPLNEVRVAMMKTPLWHLAESGTRDAMDKAASILTSHGAKVDDVSFPPEYSDGVALKRMFSLIADGEAQAAFLKEYRMDKTKVAKEISDLVENKFNYTKKERLQALDTYARMRPAHDDLVSKYDAIVTPSVPDIAPVGIDWMGDPSFNILWTGLHMPVINVPAFTGSHGLPIGLSVVAGRFFDQHLLKITEVLSVPLVENGGWRIR